MMLRSLLLLLGLFWQQANGFVAPSSPRTISPPPSVISSPLMQPAIMTRGGSSSSSKLTATTPAEVAVMLTVDVLAAAVTALTVAPLMTAFDEAITRSASGEASLWGALGNRLKSIVSKPGEFLRSPAFKWMWVVYAATYAAASGLRTFEKTTRINLGFLSTLAVTLVNMSTGIAKDSAYSKMFGTSNSDSEPARTPKRAYFTWFVRDVTAFTFILTLPKIVSAALKMPLAVATFATPIVAQYFTTILHLLGFQMVMAPKAGLLGQIQKATYPKTYFPTVAARQMRIIPPYSIGGVLNAALLSLSPLLVSLVVGSSAV